MTVPTGAAVVLAVVLLLNGALIGPVAGALVAVALIAFGVNRVVQARRADR